MNTVARVCLDSPLPHLDRPFDYAVPEPMRGHVTTGSRVRVRLAGRLVSGVVVETGTETEFAGKLLPITSTSTIPSFTPEALRLAQDIARRYGGSLWDVLRLMAPPRVAAVEKRDWSSPPASDPAYEAARRPTDEPVALPGERVVWAAVPDGERRGVPASVLVGTALECMSDGGSAILTLPDARAIQAVLDECARRGLTRWTARSGGQIAVLDHDHGAQQRFGSYVAAMRGHARLVVGTRPTVMQPVPDLRFLAVWDEGSTTLEDPHAPYPHARTVAAMRAESDEARATVVLGGFSLTAEAVSLVEHGWARLETPSRGDTRAAVPAVDVVTAERRDAEGGAGWHWMPGSVWRAVREALSRGPVAIMVPRAGYVRAVACARCDAWAECRHCHGPLSLSAPGSDPRCRDCGREQPHWHCHECHGSQLKHVRQGVERITEQLARMAPGTPIAASSSATGVLGDHAVTSGLVVATPAALPAVPHGYAHLVVLDAGAPAGGVLGGELQAVRWWLNAAALVRSRQDGGAVSIVGHLPDRARRAVQTWDPVEAAREDFRERVELNLPPHRRALLLDGPREDITAALAAAEIPLQGDEQTTVLPLDGGVTVLASRARMQAIVDAARTVQRAASSQGRHLRLRVDGPLTLPS